MSAANQATDQHPSCISNQFTEFMKEIDSIGINNEPKISTQETENSNSSSVWQPCYDENSGYWYHWNVETNEVTWEPPKDANVVNENSRVSAHRSNGSGITVSIIDGEKQKENSNNVSDSKPTSKQDGISNATGLSALTDYASDVSSDSDDREPIVPSLCDAENSVNGVNDEKIRSDSCVNVKPNESPQNDLNVSENDRKSSCQKHDIKQQDETSNSGESAAEVKSNVADSETISDGETKNVSKEKTTREFKLVDVSSESESEDDKDDRRGSLTEAADDGISLLTDDNDKLVIDGSKHTVECSENPVKDADDEDDVKSGSKVGTTIPKEHLESVNGVTNVDNFCSSTVETDNGGLQFKKKSKLISFAKSDEVFDLNHINSDTDVTKPEVNSINYVDDDDDVDAALDRALREHNESTKVNETTPLPSNDSTLQCQSSDLIIDANRQSCVIDEHEDKFSDDIKLRCVECLERMTALLRQVPFSLSLHETIVQMQTRLDDWEAKALETEHFKKCTDAVAEHKLRDLEKDSSPASWSACWDRNSRSYYFRNKSDGSCRWEFPSDAVGDDLRESSTSNNAEGGCMAVSSDSVDVTHRRSSVRESSNVAPPLPPPDFAPSTYQPPLPSSPPPPLSPTQVSVSRVNPEESELVESSLPDERRQYDGNDKSDEHQNLNIPSVDVCEEVRANDVPLTESTFDEKMDEKISTSATVIQNVSRKRKRKIKLKDDLSLKRKGMSLLVEKWEKIKEEVNID